MFHVIRRALGLVSDGGGGGGGDTAIDERAARAAIGRRLDAFVDERCCFNRLEPSEFDAAVARLAHELQVADLEYIRHLVRTSPTLMRHAALNRRRSPEPSAVASDDDDDDDDAYTCVPLATTPSDDESARSRTVESGADGDASEEFEREWTSLERELAAALERVRALLVADVCTGAYVHTSFAPDRMFLSVFHLSYERRIFSLLIEQLLAVYSETRARAEHTPYLWLERPIYESDAGVRLSLFVFRHVDDPASARMRSAFFGATADDARTSSPAGDNARASSPAGDDARTSSSAGDERTNAQSPFIDAGMNERAATTTTTTTTTLDPYAANVSNDAYAPTSTVIHL